MKHLLIFHLALDESNPLTVNGIIQYDETSPNYDQATKGFIEKTPSDKITYVDVEDSVDVDYNYLAVKNPDNTWTFTKP
jgi:hypothetical protein